MKMLSSCVVISNILFPHKGKQNKSLFLSGLFAFFFLLPNWVFGASDCKNQLMQVDSAYQEILSRYLTVGSKNSLPANMIDYSKLRKDEDFEELVKLIEVFPRECLSSKSEEIAFYLNAYNILAINKVAKHWPLERLKSLGNFMRPVWTHPAGKVCNEKVTLRILEHEVLRKFDEPRIHFAINCASMSCPDLRAEPYSAEKLDSQLEEQTKIFLNQEGKGLSHLGDNKIAVSSIFEWFAGDFDAAGGVEKFINDYLPEYKGMLVVDSYLDYDWDVNCKLNALQKKRARKADRPKTWFN